MGLRVADEEKGHQLSEEKDNNLLSEVHIATFIPFSLNLELRMTKQQQIDKTQECKITSGTIC